jgi:UDP-2,3-diacylglucosamine pyrophosphatase LpxH
MRQRLYVISDLHLGGAPAAAGGAPGSRGFQICPPATQQAMADFIDRLPAPTAEADTRLVLAGDIVDFLAEEPFAAFTPDETAALAKFRSIVANTAPVWPALRRFVGDKKGALTLMLGNHDIELSLPAVREALYAEVGGHAPVARVEFIYDNEAFTAGPVLIEHGNRFDAWNAVPHGALRRVRSQLSRRLPVAPEFPALPGSRLVVEVMNGLKKDYPFIDLLKPEDAAALPVAAALGAGGVGDVWKAFNRFRDANAQDFDESGEPLDETLIAAGSSGDQELFDLASDIAAGGEAAQVSAIGEWAGKLRDKFRREALFKAMQKFADKHRRAFDVGHEDDVYRKPAQRSAAAGFRVVVYGHTHLPKRIAIGDAVYLNTGTWADLMRMPDAVWSADGDAARAALNAFVDDLDQGALERWRRSLPTYARIELESDGKVLHADVHFASDDAPIATEAVWQRLAGGPSGS